MRQAYLDLLQQLLLSVNRGINFIAATLFGKLPKVAGNHGILWPPETIHHDRETSCAFFFSAGQ
jgi:hypothetical protein